MTGPMHPRSSNCCLTVPRACGKVICAPHADLPASFNASQASHRMLSFTDSSVPLADRVSRREWMRVGGLSALGLSLPTLLHAGERQASAEVTPKLATDLGSTFGKAKNCIFLWLQGGPPQHETFDPKPDAPAEIRGLFK